MSTVLVLPRPVRRESTSDHRKAPRSPRMRQRKPRPVRIQRTGLDAPSTARIAPPSRMGPSTPPHWKERYLELIRERGNFHRTAREAGVDPTTALRERDRDPEFDRLCQEARQEYADLAEDTMVQDSHETGNPAGLIVRLKALRPLEYIEKHAIMNVTANLAELQPDDAKALLQAMLGSTTPSTQKMLSDGA